MLNILSNYNDDPIVFHGKLEDQFQTPVAGATVGFDVRVYNGYESSPAKKITSASIPLSSLTGNRKSARSRE